MTSRELSEEERAFAEAALAFGDSIEALRNSAMSCRISGGDPQYALLASVDDDDEREVIRANWPMLSLLLGV